jgi:hypothetical protein
MLRFCAATFVTPGRGRYSSRKRILAMAALLVWQGPQPHRVFRVQSYNFHFDPIINFRYTTNKHCSCGVRVSMFLPRLRWSSISAAAPIIRP